MTARLHVNVPSETPGSGDTSVRSQTAVQADVSSSHTGDLLKLRSGGDSVLVVTKEGKVSVQPPSTMADNPIQVLEPGGSSSVVYVTKEGHVRAFNAGVSTKYESGAGATITDGDFPAGFSVPGGTLAVAQDTTTGKVYLYARVGGGWKKVELT